MAIQEKGAHITVGDLPTVKGHRRQLQQHFNNLIQNALKYNKRDMQPQVIITSKLIQGSDSGWDLMEEENNKSLHLIRVKDNGIGFD